jgi:hypothetical protein
VFPTGKVFVFYNLLLLLTKFIGLAVCVRDAASQSRSVQGRWRNQRRVGGGGWREWKRRGETKEKGRNDRQGRNRSGMRRRQKKR